MSENVTIEKEKSSSSDKDKIIIEEGESVEHVPAAARTSSDQPPIISIDSKNKDSASVGVSDSPPPQREKFHDEDVGINFDVVNIVAEKIIS